MDYIEPIEAAPAACQSRQLRFLLLAHFDVFITSRRGCGLDTLLILLLVANNKNHQIVEMSARQVRLVAYLQALKPSDDILNYYLLI